MIEQIATKLVNTYDNLSPRRKAQADMLGILFLCVFCSGVLTIAVHFNLVFEMSMLMLAYGIFGMIRILYKSRVSYYETMEKFKK